MDKCEVHSEFGEAATEALVENLMDEHITFYPTKYL
jgi:hypothetical protein